MKKALYYLFPAFVLLACQKGKNDSGVALSSEKNIGEVVFKSADNPSLARDVTGVISGDSVKIVFSKNISLSNLIPTISFTGKSMNPASKIPQNFNNTVVYTITAEDGSTKKFLFAGSNRTQSDSMILLSGKWKILRDSLSNMNFFFWENGSYHYPTPGVYYGVAEDFFYFHEDGTLSLRENQNNYSTTFRLLSNNKLSIPELDAAFDAASVITLTENKATFFWTKESTVSGGGHYGRMLYLVK